jgi:phosphoribosylformylglycinamidine cyclo-ligase
MTPLFMDYKSSGVDIEAGNTFVENLKKKAPSIGGFNGAFELFDYEEPVLISGTDGVGTKINIARIANDYTTIGEDLVAMCVNDVICSGAKPLYFLDYISTGKIDQKILDQIIQGVLKGCEIADMQLLGGETAVHPRQTAIDLAGFCTGVVESYDMITGVGIKEGDKIIGIESSGLHSNGYSLINNMLWRHKIFYKDMPELLTPTTIYAPVVKHLMEEMGCIFGMAHITGGGIPENLPRCFPEGLKPKVNYNSWRMPEIFSKIMCAGEILEEEMKKVFNLGIGFCVIVPEWAEDDALKHIASYHNCWTIGEVVVE